MKKIINFIGPFFISLLILLGLISIGFIAIIIAIIVYTFTKLYESCKRIISKKRFFWERKAWFALYEAYIKEKPRWQISGLCYTIKHTYNLSYIQKQFLSKEIKKDILSKCLEQPLFFSYVWLFSPIDIKSRIYYLEEKTFRTFPLTNANNSEKIKHYNAWVKLYQYYSSNFKKGIINPSFMNHIFKEHRPLTLCPFINTLSYEEIITPYERDLLLEEIRDDIYDLNLHRITRYNYLYPTSYCHYGERKDYIKEKVKKYLYGTKYH